MARLPIVGGDPNNWGVILNEFLSVSLNSDGTVKNNAIPSAALQNASIGTTKLDSSNSPSTNQVLSYNGTKFAWTSPSGALDSADYVISKNGSTYIATSSADGSQLSSGADAGALLTAAINALGANGGTIAFKPGLYTWSSVPALPANLNGWLRIVGQMTTINLTTSGSRFLDFNKQANGDTFRYIQVGNFTVNAASLSAVGGTQHIIIGTYRPSDGVATGTNVNFEYIVLNNLKSLDVRVAASSTAHHLNIFIGVHQDADGLSENYIKHILVENCDFDGGNHGLTIYGNKSGSWTGDPAIYLDDIVVRHIRHDMRTAPTGFDSTSHVHITSLGYGDNVIVQDVWGYGSRDVGVEVDTMMNSRIENVVIENYYGFAVALTNYNNPPQYLAQHAYVRDVVGIRNAGQASPSSSSVVGIRTTTGFPNGHFTLENIKHYRSATAPDLSVSPLAGDLVSVKGSVESLTLNGGHYEAVGAVLSGSSSYAAQIVYVDDLTSVRTRISVDNLDVRFRGAKAGGATATIALAAIQLNGNVDTNVNNVRMDVDFPNIEQVTAVDLGGASGGTIRGEVNIVKVLGANLGSNAKGVYVPSSSTVTIPYAGALRVRNVDPDTLPAGADIFIGDATNKAKVDIGLQPLAASAKTVTADYTITSSDGVILVNSASSVTVSLPSATTSGAGKQFVVKTIGTGATFVNALGGDIDGVAQITLSEPRSFVSDGTNWRTISPTSASFNLPISFGAKTVTENYSLTATDGVVFANGSGITLSLPSGTSSGAGKQFVVKNIGSSDVAVNSLGGLIEDGYSVTLHSNVTITYVSDGTNWVALHKTGNDSLVKAATSVTTNHTVASSEGSLFINGAGITVTLPSGTTSGGGKQFLLQNIGSSSAEVNALGGNVDGVGQITLNANAAKVFTSDGTNWWSS